MSRTAPVLDPTYLIEVELSEPLPPLAAAPGAYRRALVLVRLHSQPLGLLPIELPPEGLPPQQVAEQVWQALAPAIQAHLAADGLQPVAALEAQGLPPAWLPGCQQIRHALLADAPPMTVVIATRNRATTLKPCLDSLLALDYPTFSIIVVDNDPPDETTRTLIEEAYGAEPRIRYVREAQPGLAVAHNRGLQEVDTPLVAFTDDDVIVDAQWLSAIACGFVATPSVACVTGLIMPLELETAAQQWIEQYVGLNKGFLPRRFNWKERPADTPLHPYAAGQFGSGANMAFRTERLRAIGGFDPALGAGSPALGGDDLDAFFQIINHGYDLLYQPAAIVHHRHYRDYPALRRTAYGYGVGLTAFLMKTLWERPHRIFHILQKVPAALVYLLSPTSLKNQRRREAAYPAELTWLEWRGMLFGPIAYLRSRWQRRKLPRPASEQAPPPPEKR